MKEDDVDDYFNDEPSNIGIILGEASGWLVDIDLDCPEAVIIADQFLPHTPMKHGRPSAPNSHWWYTCEGVKTEKFRDSDTTLVEIRSTGGQTVAPPSMHKSGELITWNNPEALNPAVVSAGRLRQAVRRIAFASKVARRWHEKKRHDMTMALAGAFARKNIPLDLALTIVRAICIAADDEEVGDRLRAVEDTYDRIEAGVDTTGIPTLEELVGHWVVGLAFLPILPILQVRVSEPRTQGVWVIPIFLGEFPIEVGEHSLSCRTGRQEPAICKGRVCDFPEAEAEADSGRSVTVYRLFWRVWLALLWIATPDLRAR